jgi:hypothetical protein
MRNELADTLKARHPVLLQNITHFECDDGWYDLIDTLCQSIDKRAFDENGERIMATQIKEKFAGLRFYTNYSDNEVDAMIGLAEKLSFRICEDCGSPGKVVTTGYWIKTLCDHHRDELGFREMNPKSD